MEFHASFLALLRLKLSLVMIRSRFESDERAIEQQFLRFRPQRDGPVDARLALAAKTVLGLHHRNRQNGEKHVAIVRLAQGVLQQREGLRHRFERWFEILKTFERIPKPFAGNAKIVQPRLIAPLQAAGEPANLAHARLQHAGSQLDAAGNTAQRNRLGFHVRRDSVNCARRSRL